MPNLMVLEETHNISLIERRRKQEHNAFHVSTHHSPTTLRCFQTYEYVLVKLSLILKSITIILHIDFKTDGDVNVPINCLDGTLIRILVSFIFFNHFLLSFISNFSLNFFVYESCNP